MKTIILLAIASLFYGDFSFANEVTNFQKLTFLSGCWSGEVYGSTAQEHWGDQAGSTMLGTSKTTKDGQLESFEFLKIQIKESSVVYTPYIEGKEAVSFNLLEVSNRKAIFENLQNDFPQTIKYELINAGLLITLKGSSDEFAYTLESVNCIQWN